MHPPGRLTLPRVSLLSSEFRYTTSNDTNVAQTIERERLLQAQELARQQRLAESGQPMLPCLCSKPTVTRLRAGLGQVIELPLI